MSLVISNFALNSSRAVLPAASSGSGINPASRHRHNYASHGPIRGNERIASCHSRRDSRSLAALHPAPACPYTSLVAIEGTRFAKARNGVLALHSKKNEPLPAIQASLILRLPEAANWFCQALILTRSNCFISRNRTGFPFQARQRRFPAPSPASLYCLGWSRPARY